MNTYIGLMSVLLVFHQIITPMVVEKPKPKVKIQALAQAPASIPAVMAAVHEAQEVEGRSELTPSAPSMSELVAAPVVVHAPSDEGVVVKVVYPEQSVVPASIVSAQDQKSGVEVRVVHQALGDVGAQAAAFRGPLAPAAGALVAAAAQAVQEHEGEMVRPAPFVFNGARDQFSDRIKMMAKHRAQGAWTLESKAGKEDQEKIKKEFPNMPEFIIKYVLGRTYDSDTEFKKCDERYYLLNLCDVGFAYLNSKELWVATVKAESPHLDDIDARSAASLMIKKAIMFEFCKKWYQRFLTCEARALYEDDERKFFVAYSPVWHHSEHWKFTSDCWYAHYAGNKYKQYELRAKSYYQAMIELWQQAKESNNPADKLMLGVTIPLKMQHPQEEDNSKYAVGLPEDKLPFKLKNFPTKKDSSSCSLM